MKRLIILTVLLFGSTHYVNADIERIDIKNLPKIKLSETNSIMIKNYLRQKDKSLSNENIVMKLVCQNKKKGRHSYYQCQGITIDSPRDNH
jgi:hypothetical protein